MALGHRHTPAPPTTVRLDLGPWTASFLVHATIGALPHRARPRRGSRAHHCVGNIDGLNPDGADRLNPLEPSAPGTVERSDKVEAPPEHGDADEARTQPTTLIVVKPNGEEEGAEPGANVQTTVSAELAAPSRVLSACTPVSNGARGARGLGNSGRRRRRRAAGGEPMAQPQQPQPRTRE